GPPRPHIDDLTPLYRGERLRLEDGDPSATARIIGLLAPIGKGQRGLIVSPPKAGKTMVLQAIATAIANSHPEVVLMLVLVGERPEEVTDSWWTRPGIPPPTPNSSARSSGPADPAQPSRRATCRTAPQPRRTV